MRPHPGSYFISKIPEILFYSLNKHLSKTVKVKNNQNKKISPS